MFRSLAPVLLAATLTLPAAPPLAAEQTEDAMIFHILNYPNPNLIDTDQWARATQEAGLSDRTRTVYNASGDQMVADIRRASRDGSGEAVFVLYGVVIDVADFANGADAVEANIRRQPAHAQVDLRINTERCRLLHSPLKPTNYAPEFTLLAPTDPEGQRLCYAQALGLFDGLARDPASAIDRTAIHAQTAMPQMMRYGSTFLDKADDGRTSHRPTNIFAPGDEIHAEISLDYVSRTTPGEPGARYRIGLDIEVYDAANTLLNRQEDVTVYEGEMRHRVPVDAEYFRNFVTAGLSLDDPGNYQLVFILTDLVRENAEPLRVGMPVRIGLEPDLPAFAVEAQTTQRIHAPDPAENYTLRRCAALYQSRVVRIGRETMDEAEFTRLDARIQYFLQSDMTLQMGPGNVSQDLARTRTLSAMHALSALYRDRMAQQASEGTDPWLEDPLLRRDEAFCDHLFETRPE
ncbi:hypothetical protein AAD018_017400 [Aestuariibius insulae]|uniref:hypothetical protein n=1 Tax=Aestuariibius insulae TaxID=2058287 RepID=UPI00345E0922